MQLLVLIAALIGTTTSQRTYIRPENVTKVPATTVCLQGTSEFGFVDEVCSNDQDMCITSLTILDGLYEVTKSCSNTEECLMKQRSGEKLCTGFDPKTTDKSTCHVCCVGDWCNSFSDIEEAYNIVSRIKLAP